MYAHASHKHALTDVLDEFVAPLQKQLSRDGSVQDEPEGEHLTSAMARCFSATSTSNKCSSVARACQHNKERVASVIPPA